MDNNKNTYITEKSEGGGVVQPIPCFTERTALHVKSCKEIMSDYTKDNR